MRVNIVIDYHWNSGDEVKEEHKEMLKEHAEERIAEMRTQGYYMGELICEYEEDGEEFYYSGWWGSKTEEVSDIEFKGIEEFAKRFDKRFITLEQINKLWNSKSAQHGGKYNKKDFRDCRIRRNWKSCY